MRHLGNNHAQHHRVAMHHLVAVGAETLTAKLDGKIHIAGFVEFLKLLVPSSRRSRSASSSFVATKFSGMISRITNMDRPVCVRESRRCVSAGYRSTDHKSDFQLSYRSGHLPGLPGDHHRAPICCINLFITIRMRIRRCSMRDEPHNIGNNFAPLPRPSPVPADI